MRHRWRGGSVVGDLLELKYWKAAVWLFNDEMSGGNKSPDVLRDIRTRALALRLPNATAVFDSIGNLDVQGSS